MKKTDRKNKTGLTVTWPNGLFTHEDCHALNSDFIGITLRVRIKKAITAGSVNEIGVLQNGKGRPSKVMVNGPITQELVALAKSRSIILKPTLTVNVMNIQPVVTTVSQPLVFQPTVATQTEEPTKQHNTVSA
jgi:hypothetical protein